MGGRKVGQRWGSHRLAITLERESREKEELFREKEELFLEIFKAVE